MIEQIYNLPSFDVFNRSKGSVIGLENRNSYGPLLLFVPRRICLEPIGLRVAYLEKSNEIEHCYIEPKDEILELYGSRQKGFRFSLRNFEADLYGNFFVERVYLGKEAINQMLIGSSSLGLQ